MTEQAPPPQVLPIRGTPAVRAIVGKAEPQEKEKSLLKYAREYVVMGDECLKHNMLEAALRNYDKAVTLCPQYKEAWKKIKKTEKMMKNK